MQSSFNILTALYKLIDVAEINSILQGKIYIGEAPLTEQSESICLNLLNNPNKYLQTGFCNLNTYIPKLQSGRDNLGRFQELIDIIIPIVEDSEINTTKGTFFFQIDDDKGVFDDKDRDGMSYYNLRLEFQTFK